MYYRIYSLLALAFLIAGGCSHQAGPALAGGKPPDYWLKNASSPDIRLRKEAITKLGNLGAAEPQVLPALTGALHDADAGVRSEAVLALAKLGAAAKPAVPDLQALAQSDPDAKVRDFAARAVEKLR